MRPTIETGTCRAAPIRAPRRDERVRQFAHISGHRDQRFCRMWEFYLASSELAFRYGGLMVFQAQLARQLDSVPLTRDYMYEREREGSRIGTMRRLTLVKRESQA
jgi:hypothetical protein